MTIISGTKLGAYEILSPLGAGGMGEVYRAKDTRLDREVAIKVLPAEFAQDADRLQRFEQEARATSALNHPNILTVYDIGTHDGAPFIVAELLEGEELRVQLNEGVLPVKRAIDYAQQIAAGLAAAHAKGITHRDLKPENLFVTKDGRVKILDFGLAKLKPQTMSGGTDSDAPTMKPLTNPGLVMGTVGYMSPEQVRGAEVDHRSDIFSFGIILHEMLSGQRTFAGDSLVELMNAILKDEPAELSETNAKISPALDKIVRRCLEKKPERRFQTASDLGFALEALTMPSGSRLETATALPALTGSLAAGKAGLFGNARLSMGVAAALLLVALPFVVAYFRRPQAESYPARFSLALPEKMSGITSLALSPDGRRLAFVGTHEGKRLIWVRPINSLSAQPLAGTDEVSNLFWSPDSRFIGFFAGGKLKKIEATGGPAQTLCDASNGKGGTWNREGVIVFQPGSSQSASGLYRVPAAGGVPVQVTTLDETRQESTHRWPQFLPDGRHFLYFASSTRAANNNAIYVGSLDAKDRKLILATQSSVAWCPPGYLLFVRERTLMAQEFDAARLQLTGEPVSIAEQVGYESGGNVGLSYFAISENGVLTYKSGGEANRNFAWFDRSGKELSAVNPVGMVYGVTLSPDGKRAAIELLEQESGANTNIWLIDLERNMPSRFTFHAAFHFLPIWSPDGSRIVFSSGREGKGIDIYQKLSSGAGSEELLLKSDVRKSPTDWSVDGRHILFTKNDPKTGEDLWVLPLFGDRQPFPFLATEFQEKHGHFSPNGHWIAYESNESGRFEVYAQSFPAAGGKKQISTGGGVQPLWRRDGRELFYLTPERKLMSVEVKMGASFEASVPKPLFETRLGSFLFDSIYAVSPDGQRFLINVSVGEQAVAPINVVTNWLVEVKK